LLGGAIGGMRNRSFVSVRRPSRAALKWTTALIEEEEDWPGLPGGGGARLGSQQVSQNWQ
jgi:hypothetical protein